MTDKELKRLRRSELLQMLLEQTVENEQLREKVQKLEEELEQRKITCEKAGSIAEASLILNDVFKSADLAAQNYLKEIKDRIAKQDDIINSTVAEAEKKAAEIIAKAEKKAAEILKNEKTEEEPEKAPEESSEKE